MTKWQSKILNHRAVLPSSWRICWGVFVESYNQPLPTWKTPALFPIQICTSRFEKLVRFCCMALGTVPIPQIANGLHFWMHASSLLLLGANRKKNVLQKCSTSYWNACANLNMRESGRFSYREWLVVRFGRKWLVVRFYKHLQQMCQHAQHARRCFRFLHHRFERIDFSSSVAWHIFLIMVGDMHHQKKKSKRQNLVDK